MENLETQVRRAGRRVALALTAAGALIGASVASIDGVGPGWVPPALGVLGGGLTLGLLIDLLRRGR
jgi:ubiquinone biosynthesis protein